MLAICTASRPTTLSVASITNQRCFSSLFFAMKVNITASKYNNPGHQEVVMIKGPPMASRGTWLDCATLRSLYYLESFVFDGREYVMPKRVVLAMSGEIGRA